MFHLEDKIFVPVKAEEVFSFVDDHMNFSSHMTKPSLMMGGGKMEIITDDKHGQAVGSHIKLNGKIFGIELYLDEVITERNPPLLKVWKTVGTPKLLIIGDYQMKVQIELQEKGSLLQVSIDYELPKKNVLLGKLFGEFYAKWCVNQMITDTKNNFRT